jgi:serine protease AprX
MQQAPVIGSTRPTRPLLLAVIGLLALALVQTASSSGAPALHDRSASVIVRELAGSGLAGERAVERLGGQVGMPLSIIGGFEARLPQASVATLRSAPGIASVTLNETIEPLFHTWDLDLFGGGQDQPQDPGSMSVIGNVVGVHAYWSRHLTGEGVDVALIDTGVVPVQGISSPGKVVNGADLSFESQSDSLRYLDTYGHGTHLAGIIAGEAPGASEQEPFRGIAPDARLVSVKVGNAQGAADVSQVIAAIDWVVRHRHDEGLNIRVLTLAFGTDGVQDYLLDPLAYAVEVAWRKGIVVVVAAGNEGFGSSKLNDPANDPHVLAVGAEDPVGTQKVSDDTIPHWSSRGDASRHPDLVAPGVSVTSLRAPGSFLDERYPGARRGDGLFKGSGTSQAAAVAGGAAALIVQQRPAITPDQVKALLMGSATPIPGADPLAQGAGLIDLRAARTAPTPDAVQSWPPAGGAGSLELSRGSGHVVDETGIALDGERNIFGYPWSPLEWTATCWTETSWEGGSWNGTQWSGAAWTGQSWAERTWLAVPWSDPTWTGQPWAEQRTAERSWTGKSWAGDGWGGKSWGGKSWAASVWSSVSWG